MGMGARHHLRQPSTTGPAFTSAAVSEVLGKTSTGASSICQMSTHFRRLGTRGPLVVTSAPKYSLGPLWLVWRLVGSAPSTANSHPESVSSPRDHVTG